MGKGKKEKRDFVSSSPEEDAIKKAFEERNRIEKANRVISGFMKQFPGKSLIQILPVLIRYCSDKTIAKIAIERIERNQGEKLSFEDRAFLKEVKSQLERNEEEIFKQRR